MASIRQKADGRWMTRVQKDGRITEFSGKTEKEVKAKLKAFEAKVARGEAGTTEHTTEEYINFWVDEVKSQPGVGKRHKTLSVQSLIRFRSSVRVHIIPRIGYIKLKNLNSMTIQRDLINAMLAEPKSISSIKKVYDALYECLKYAVSIKQLPYNPMDQVKMPVERVFEEDEPNNKIRVLNAKEIEKFEQTINSRYRNGKYRFRNGWGYWLLLNTGARSGEGTAWNWKDYKTEINELGETIHYIKISKTVIVSDNPDRTPKMMAEIQGHPKTLNSKRNVYLNEAGIAAIEELKKMSLGKFIIDNAKGGMIAPSNFERNFGRLMDYAGIEGHTIHDLRHTYATKLFQSGVPPKLGSEILGQGDVNVYLKTYVEINDKDREEAMKKIKF